MFPQDDPFGRKCPKCGNTLQNAAIANNSNMIRCADCKEVFQNNLIGKKFCVREEVWAVIRIAPTTVVVKGFGPQSVHYVPAEMFYRWVYDAELVP